MHTHAHSSYLVCDDMKEGAEPIVCSAKTQKHEIVFDITGRQEKRP